MPFCRHCGHQYEGAANFCPECGQPQIATAETSHQQPPTVEEEPERTLWEGESQNLINLASSGRLVSSRYRLTNRTLYFNQGLITTNSQQVPLWAIRDIDVKQFMLQKMRRVADVIVRVEHSDYTGRSVAELRDIEEATKVRDLLNQHAQRERFAYQQRQQTRYYGR
jgi:hypothetical protein